MTEAVSTPLLSVNNLRKYFPVQSGFMNRVSNWVKAVDDVSFSINTGEVLGMVGESGCGKTTVARSLMRLIEPTSGEVYFDGSNLLTLPRAELRRLRRKIQIVFQDPYRSLNPRMSVNNIVGEALRIHENLSPGQAEQRVVETLEKVGLSADYRFRYPHEFSGGQRQRIGIARALILQPKLLICDEAVSALDVSVQAQFLNLLRDLHDELNLTYFFISHDLNVVRHIVDRVAVMYLGQIVELAETKQLFSSPKHPYTQALLEANPKVRPGGRKVVALLQGDVPSPIDPPPGCRFHTRCPKVMDICRESAPELLPDDPVNKATGIRCFLYD
ncbi:ABC transporter ATP-binding protein [Pseudomonadota bacterium]